MYKYPTILEILTENITNQLYRKITYMYRLACT